MTMEINELEQLYEEQCKEQKEEKARSLENLPFADFKNWADCIRKTKAKYPDWDEERCKRYCGGIKAKTEEASAKFVVHYLSYMGQVVVRGIPHQRWFLRLREGDKIHSWSADIDFTRFSPVALEYEGIVDSKWFDYEGDIKPETKYNPSKSLTAKIQVIDKGSCSVDTETVEGSERLSIVFQGKELKGKHVVMQEEKGSSMYTIERLAEELEAATFVLQAHYISKGIRKVKVIEEIKDENEK